MVKNRTLVPVIRSPPYSGIRSVIPSQVAESPRYNGQARPSIEGFDCILYNRLFIIGITYSNATVDIVCKRTTANRAYTHSLNLFTELENRLKIMRDSCNHLFSHLIHSNAFESNTSANASITWQSNASASANAACNSTGDQFVMRVIIHD